MTGGLLVSGAISRRCSLPALPAQHRPSTRSWTRRRTGSSSTVATVNGSGCPKDTAAVAVSQDNTAFTVTYSEYLAQVGGGAPPTAFRKNCQLNLIVHVPAAASPTRSPAPTTAASPRCSRGASGTEKASYYFQGSPDTAVPNPHVRRPLRRQLAGHRRRPTGRNWSGRPAESQRNFNINTELRVNAGTSAPSSDQLHDHGLDGRRHQHRLPPGLEGVPREVRHAAGGATRNRAARPERDTARATDH